MAQTISRIEERFEALGIEFPISGDLIATDPNRQAGKCECGNTLSASDCEVYGDLCEWCDAIKDEPPHKGHWSTGGTYWCDTCNSPYCELA